jgi:hypothetical protein
MRARLAARQLPARVGSSGAWVSEELRGLSESLCGGVGKLSLGEWAREALRAPVNVG